MRWLSQAEGWQTMETAPKDGTEVIVENVQLCRVLAHWQPGGHCIEDHPAIAAGWYFWNGHMYDVFRTPMRWLPVGVIGWRQ